MELANEDIKTIYKLYSRFQKVRERFKLGGGKKSPNTTSRNKTPMREMQNILEGPQGRLDIEK